MSLLRNRFSDSHQKPNPFQLGGIFIAEKTYSDSLKINFGLYGNQELFGTFLVPIAGLKWKINQHFTIDTKIPLNARIAYHFNKKHSLSLYFRGIISSFNHQNDDVNNFLSNELYSSFSYNEVSFLYEIEPVKSFVIQFKVGQFIGTNIKTYSLEDKIPLAISIFKFGDERKEPQTYKLDNPFVGLSLIWRLHLED